VHVHLVGDDLGAEARQCERSADGARGPVPQRGHRVEGVRHVPGAAGDGGGHLLVGRVGVADADGDAAAQALVEQVVGAVGLGCDGDQPDGAGVEEGGRLLAVDAADLGRVLGAAAGATEVRALHVRAEDPCSAGGRPGLRDRAERGEGRLPARRPGRGQPGGDPARGEEPRHRQQPRDVAVHGLVPHGTVHVHVDEARHQDLPPQVDDRAPRLQRVVRRPAAEAGDRAAGGGQPAGPGDRLRRPDQPCAGEQQVGSHRRASGSGSTSSATSV
jgi:hypothetical protein